MRATAKQSAKRRGTRAAHPPKKKTKAAATTPPRTRLDVDERRAQLVELGLAEFGTRTYDEVSIDLIAQSAGISKGLLYHYFPTKRAFYAACVREACARLIHKIDVVTEGTPLEQLGAGLDRYLDHVRAHGRAFATLMRSGVGADPEIAALVDETRATLLDRLTGGMNEFFPASSETLASPLLKVALHGWIGLVEAASIAWVEQCVQAEANSADPTPATKADVRDVLAKALVAIVESVVVR
jgi:AcrR family transcriptional regulator